MSTGGRTEPSVLPHAWLVASEVCLLRSCLITKCLKIFWDHDDTARFSSGKSMPQNFTVCGSGAGPSLPWLCPIFPVGDGHVVPALDNIHEPLIVFSSRVTGAGEASAIDTLLGPTIGSISSGHARCSLAFRRWRSS